MTTVAAKLLSDFETLTPDEQLLVRERVISLTQRIQQDAVQNLRGSSEGKHLLRKLLEDRATERNGG